jgi:hypothetical protein
LPITENPEVVAERIGHDEKARNPIPKSATRNGSSNCLIMDIVRIRGILAHMRPDSMKNNRRHPLRMALINSSWGWYRKDETLPFIVAYQSGSADWICASLRTKPPGDGERVSALASGKWQYGSNAKTSKDIFGAPGPFLGTFHSFGARICDRGLKVGRTANFVIYDDADTFQLVKRAKERGGPGRCWPRPGRRNYLHIRTA